MNGVVLVPRRVSWWTVTVSLLWLGSGRAEQPEGRSLSFHGAKLYARVAGPEGAHGVLLLHGARFHSATWQRTGTYRRLAAEGYRVMGLDLPGFGRSEQLEVDREKLLAELLPSLGLKRPVLVAPSMSGGYAFPLVVHHPEMVSGWVAVAPVGIPRYEKELATIRLPTLILWGEDDRVVPLSQGELLRNKIAQSRMVVLPGARHPCYLDRPARFHRALLDFLRSLH